MSIKLDKVKLILRKSESIPDYLYHYTSSQGLIGIAGHSCLWATHYLCMNDRLELIHAISQLKKLITSSQFEQTVVLEHFVSFLSELLDGVSEDVFIVSLTRHKDQLAQWRGYCPAGGYAIGFPRELIQSMATAQDYSLMRCNYSHDDCMDFFRELYDVHLEHVKTIKPTDKKWALRSVMATMSMIDVIKKYGPIFKHLSFRHEGEWRLIYSPTEKQEFHSQKEIHYRPGINSIVPYRIFKLTDKDHTFNDFKPIRVVIGPGQDRNVARITVSSFLRQYFPKFKIDYANTSYRGV